MSVARHCMTHTTILFLGNDIRNDIIKQEITIEDQSVFTKTNRAIYIVVVYYIFFRNINKKNI